MRTSLVSLVRVIQIFEGSVTSSLAIGTLQQVVARAEVDETHPQSQGPARLAAARSSNRPSDEGRSPPPPGAGCTGRPGTQVRLSRQAHLRSSNSRVATAAMRRIALRRAPGGLERQPLVYQRSLMACGKHFGDGRHDMACDPLVTPA